MAANEVERKRWNDEHAVLNWPKRERLTDRVTPYVIAALAPQAGEKVLDIGCGGGKLSLAAAERVRPGGKVLGADISEGMVAMAAGRAAEAKAKSVTFVATDAQVDKIKGGPFDAAISQFGVMFFDEPVAAFANIRKHLKQGGRLAFACWQPAAANAWFVGAAMAAFITPPPPPAPGKSPTGPFSLGDPTCTRGVLTEAGFVDITRTARTLAVRVAEDTLANAATLPFFGVPPAKLKAAQAAMDAHFAKFRQVTGLPRYELKFQVFTARNP